MARGRWGQFDFVLAVGDVEPNRGYEDHLGVVGPPRYRKVGDFSRVASGDITLGAPLYFIAGNHDPYPALDQAGAGEWAPGVWWLGRWGITKFQDINVGFLSDIYSHPTCNPPLWEGHLADSTLSSPPSKTSPTSKKSYPTWDTPNMAKISCGLSTKWASTWSWTTPKNTNRKSR